ncbi:MAG: magnesium transporter [Desulfurococcaceae archaeon]
MTLSDVGNTLEKITDMLQEDKLAEVSEILRQMAPHEIVEILLRLSPNDRKRIFSLISLEMIIDELAKLPAEIVHEITSIKGTDDLVKIIQRLPVDEAADFLIKLPPRIRLTVLRSLPKEIAHTIARLMKFPPESIGGVMTTMVPVFTENTAVGEALDVYIQRSRLGLYESGNYVYVVDEEGRLVGYTDVKTLLMKPRNVELRRFMLPVKVAVTPFEDREKAAKVAISYDLMEVPVVDFDHRFMGIITLDDLLDVVVSEYSEDLLKYAGYAEAVKGNYVTENPAKLALKRAPVLILLYLVNSITGTIIASFVDIIERMALLAAFMPMLADNSGNIGAQSSAIILRGLVTGEIKLTKRDLTMILLKEFTSTTIMILILSPAAFTIGFSIAFLSSGVLSYSLRIAIIVSTALIVSCFVADLVGSLFPVLLSKFKIDPATASAPMITSIADIATVAIYFIVASALFATQ